MGILKWTLYAVLFLFSMLLQEIILPRMTISGIALCAVPVCVVCIAVQEGVEHSALFALLAGTVFCLSGVDCGPLYIVTLTLSAVGLKTSSSSRPSWTLVITQMLSSE